MKRLIATLLIGLPLCSWAKSVDLSLLPEEVRQSLLKEDPSLSGRDVPLDRIDALLRKVRGLPGVERVGAWESPAGTIAIRAEYVRRIGAVNFKGTGAVSESDVRSAMALSKGDALSMEALVDAAERVRTLYRENGVLNPVINVETPEAGPGVFDLSVDIQEGPVTLISSWTVSSPDSDLNSQLVKLIENKISGRYNEARVQEAQSLINEVLRKGRHLRAEVQPVSARFNADETRVDLTIRLDKVESYSVAFRGNREFSASTLEKDILDLPNFSTANPNVTSELTDKIRQAYLARGYARIEVTQEETEGRTPFSRRIFFEISEGPRVRLDSFKISGRISRPEKYYEDLIRENSTSLIRSGYYNREDLEIGFKNLILALQNEGHLVAKMVSTRTQYTRDRTKLIIQVNLDEGPLTVVEKVSFEGNSRISSAELAGLLDLQPGGPLRLNQIEASIQAIKGYYQGRGFIEMAILNEREDLVTYNEDNSRATLNFRLFEGPQVRVASILVDGNSFTKDYVILNELDFEVGDLLTPTAIDESISRLQRTGHFGSVEIKTLEERTAAESRTIIVRVSERNPGAFTFGAGITNESGVTLRGYTGVAYRNLYGTGRGVSARIDGNYNVSDVQYFETNITIGYLEPFLFFTRNRGRINLTRQNSVSDFETLKVTVLNQTTYSIERDFSSHVTGIWDVWSLSTFRDFYLPKSTSPDRESETELDIALTGLKLDLDYRNNPFNPTQGHLTKLAVDYASPMIGSKNSDEFYRATASYTFYLPLPHSDVVWANALRGGYLKSVSGGLDGGVPYDKVGFVLGGRSTLRGFEAGTSEVFPNNADLGTDSYKLLTSANMGLIKSEARFPLWGESLGGAIFYDGGTVNIEGVKFADSFRDSIGIGIRYNTPVGPLSLEYGWKLDRRAGEEPGRFHLSVGAF